MFPLPGQPLIRPYSGTNIPKPITPPRKMNEAIRSPTMNPTERSASESSAPAYNLVPMK